MIVFTGTSFVPTTVLIILFVILGIQLTPLSQFVYAQTVDNEIIENTLEQVEKATTGISEITESLNNASKATDSTNTSDSSILYDQSEFKDSARNWTKGESDTLSFTYPSNWNVNISDSRFDNYELLVRDKASNASIQVSDEAIKPEDKVYIENGPEEYVDMYMKYNLPLSSDADKIDTYPKGKVSIAGLPAYSELYLDQGNAILISLAFQEGNDRHYTVFSASPSSEYDNLEPTMLEIIKSIMPKTVQKSLEREVEIPFNNTESGNLNSTHDTEQLQKEDPKKRESLLSNTIERNNTSDTSQTIEQEGQQQQENDSLIQQFVKVYEGLGIKLKYFDPWNMIFQFDNPECYKTDSCYILLFSEGNAVIYIAQDKLTSPKIKDKCKCNTLEDYTRYVYTNNFSKFDEFYFINDNKTTISENSTAIQLEYMFLLAGIENHIFTILTKDNDSFYEFTFQADNTLFLKYLSDFKKMVDTVKFISQESKQKQPSFMLGFEDTTKSSQTIVDRNKTASETDDIESVIDDNREKPKEVLSDVEESKTTTITSPNNTKGENGDESYKYLKGQWIKFKPALLIESDNSYLDILSKSKFSSFMKNDWGVDNIDELEWILYNITDLTENNLNLTSEIKLVGLNNSRMSFSHVDKIDDFSHGFNFVLSKDWSLGDTMQYEDNVFEIKRILQKQYFGNNFDVYEVINKRYLINEDYPYAMEFITTSYYDNKTRLLLENIMNIKAAIPSIGTINSNASLTAIDWSYDKELPSIEQDTFSIIKIVEGAAIQGNPNYEPNELTVSKGTIITVNNTDTMPHTITNGKSVSDPNSGKNFDTSITMGGESAEIETSTIDVGTYPYYCSVHPYMRGTLIIQ
jgi:plastocyanin